MDAFVTGLTSLLTAAGTLTPVAIVALTPLVIIALLIYIIYFQISKQPSKRELSVIATNHLHDLPLIAHNTQVMVDTLQRMELQQTREFATIIARIEKNS